jgi:hypothetical protein
LREYRFCHTILLERIALGITEGDPDESDFDARLWASAIWR